MTRGNGNTNRSRTTCRKRSQVIPAGAFDRRFSHLCHGFLVPSHTWVRQRPFPVIP